jgi:hypothetical protein
MHLTKHAHTRMQQRGISSSVVNLLYTYGRDVERGKREALLYFDKTARDMIQKALPREEYAQIDKKLNAYMVVASDGSVVTVGHRYKEIRH